LEKCVLERPAAEPGKEVGMYGNEGERWVMIKKLSINGLMINEEGTEFEISPYYSVPHGYTSIKYEGILLFIPDKIFEEHFVRWDKYKQYYKLGDIIKINANGNLGDYSIEEIDGDGCYVTLSLKRD
jgi:hypothetical protein